MSQADARAQRQAHENGTAKPADSADYLPCDAVFTNSSKTIFLVLWIVSMFIIAAVLIVIEYQDNTLRK